MLVSWIHDEIVSSEPETLARQSLTRKVIKLINKNKKLILKKKKKSSRDKVIFLRKTA